MRGCMGKTRGLHMPHVGESIVHTAGEPTESLCCAFKRSTFYLKPSLIEHRSRLFVFGDRICPKVARHRNRFIADRRGHEKSGTAERLAAFFAGRTCLRNEQVLQFGG